MQKKSASAATTAAARGARDRRSPSRVGAARLGVTLVCLKSSVRACRCASERTSRGHPAKRRDGCLGFRRGRGRYPGASNTALTNGSAADGAAQTDRGGRLPPFPEASSPSPRVESGRAPIHALERLWNVEHFDRIVAPPQPYENPATRPRNSSGCSPMRPPKRSSCAQTQPYAQRSKPPNLTARSHNGCGESSRQRSPQRRFGPANPLATRARSDAHARLWARDDVPGPLIAPADHRAIPFCRVGFSCPRVTSSGWLLARDRASLSEPARCFYGEDFKLVDGWWTVSEVVERRPILKAPEMPANT